MYMCLCVFNIYIYVCMYTYALYTVYASIALLWRRFQARVSLTGQSAGGAGAWRFAAEYGELWSSVWALGVSMVMGDPPIAGCFVMENHI